MFPREICGDKLEHNGTSCQEWIKKKTQQNEISILKNQLIESFKNEIISGNYKIVSFEKNVCKF